MLRAETSKLCNSALRRQALGWKWKARLQCFSCFASTSERIAKPRKVKACENLLLWPKPEKRSRP